MILSPFRKDPAHEAAQTLYRLAVEQARLPAFYEKLGVADSVEGRTEMVMLHVFLVLQRLKGDAAAKKVARGFSEAFFTNMDGSLREAGVGDLVVGKKIRKIAEGLHGRFTAYDSAMIDGAEPVALPSALARNVYFTDAAARAEPLARYVRAARARLAEQGAAQICAGLIDFPCPEQLP